MPHDIRARRFLCVGGSKLSLHLPSFVGAPSSDNPALRFAFLFGLLPSTILRSGSARSAARVTPKPEGEVEDFLLRRVVVVDFIGFLKLQLIPGAQAGGGDRAPRTREWKNNEGTDGRGCSCVCCSGNGSGWKLRTLEEKRTAWKKWKRRLIIAGGAMMSATNIIASKLQ